MSTFKVTVEKIDKAWNHPNADRLDILPVTVEETLEHKRVAASRPPGRVPAVPRHLVSL